VRRYERNARLEVNMDSSLQLLALFGNLGTTELIIILIIGLLLFGRRLPEVGRSLGKGIVEFKKGVKGIEDDIDSDTPGRRDRPVQQRELPPHTAPADDLRASRQPSHQETDQRAGESPA
jgi:sec-independent protein translocase protein TatA